MPALRCVFAAAVVTSLCGLIRADDQPANAATKPASPPRPFTAFFPGWTPAEQRIHAALDDHTSINFLDTPLSDALEFISRQHEIPVVMDVRALEEAGILTDEPVNAIIKDITLRSVLKLTLSDLELGYVVRSEVLLVTTQARANSMYTTRIYPVRDLVTDEPETALGELVDAIQVTAGTQWDEGGVTPVTAAGSLVVTQPQRGHEAVVDLLNALRRARSFDPDAPVSHSAAEVGQRFVESGRMEIPLQTKGRVLRVDEQNEASARRALDQKLDRLKELLATAISSKSLEQSLGKTGCSRSCP